jgi:hypothetical protein
MRTPGALFAFITLLWPSLIFAQGAHESCPGGLKYVGTLRGTGSLVELLDTRLEISLPEDAMLDTSYQQTKVVAPKSKGLKLRPPKGIHIEAYGVEDYGKQWDVGDPKLITISDADGKTRYVFGMHLHCTVSEYARQFSGCAVNVDVCYKPLR